MARIRKITDNKSKNQTRLVRFLGTKKHITQFLHQTHKIAKKELYLPLPDNKLGKFLNKRRTIIPKYLRESWSELKQVNWPNRKQTISLTFAVFVFAIIFGIIVAIIDSGLNQLFKQLLLQ